MTKCNIVDCEKPASRKLLLLLPSGKKATGDYCEEHEPAAEILEEEVQGE